MGFWSTDDRQNTGLAIRLHIHHSDSSKVLGHPHLLVSELEAIQDHPENPYAPLPYFTDAIVGLSAFKLLVHSKESLSSNEEALAALLWQKLEPMHEVYHRSFYRIKTLLATKSMDPISEMNFEQSLRDIVKSACTNEGTYLNELTNLIDSINYLETKRSHPLLFDTKLQLSNSSLSILHTLYSLLYNLRALTAIHYNGNRKDNLFETLQIDSVKDYFHAPDLLTNESMLYYKFIQYRQETQSGIIKDDSMIQAFKAYLPHSHYLVTSLPEDFFTKQSSESLEQSLYTFQIDWLLGSPAGLLYRVREELIGLKEGYEHTFWPELHSDVNPEPASTLHVNCILGPEHIRQLSEAA